MYTGILLELEMYMQQYAYASKRCNSLYIYASIASKC